MWLPHPVYGLWLSLNDVIFVAFWHPMVWTLLNLGALVLSVWIELHWISQLVNLWFYAPNFAEVMVIQKLWVLYNLVCRCHVGVPLWYTNMAVTPRTWTKVDFFICLSLCYFKCLLVSLLKVCRTKIFKFAHNPWFLITLLIKSSYLPRLLSKGLTCETLENIKVAASLNV